MALSARNQFLGTVVSVRRGAVMSEVTIDIGGGHQIVSLISTSSVKRLKLKKGKPAVAVVNVVGEPTVKTNGVALLVALDTIKSNRTVPLTAGVTVRVELVALGRLVREPPAPPICHW